MSNKPIKKEDNQYDEAYKPLNRKQVLKHLYEIAGVPEEVFEEISKKENTSESF